MRHKRWWISDAMSATAAVPFPAADVTRRHRGLRVLMLNPSSGAPAYTHNL